jgi:hypothetical protein
MPLARHLSGLTAECLLLLPLLRMVAVLMKMRQQHQELLQLGITSSRRQAGLLLQGGAVQLPAQQQQHRQQQQQLAQGRQVSSRGVGAAREPSLLQQQQRLM